MKKLLQSAVVLGVVSLAGAGALNAQGAGRASFHVAGGVVLPQGDFNDAAKMGWQGLGGVSFGIGAIPFVIRIDGFYGQNSGDENFFGASGIKAKFFGGMAGGEYVIGSAASAVKPYILAQVGAVNGKVTGPGGEIDLNTKFAWNGGAGVQFGMGSMHAFVEAKYLSISTEGGSTKMIPILVGLQFGGGM